MIGDNYTSLFVGDKVRHVDQDRVGKVLSNWRGVICVKWYDTDTIAFYVWHLAKQILIRKGH